MITVLSSGLGTGAIYALVAIGFNLTLTTAGVLNFAFPHFVIVGAFVAAWGLTNGVPLIVVFLLAGVIGAAIGGLSERAAIRFLRPDSVNSELVTTVGIGTILTGFAVVLFGSNPRPVPILQSSSVKLFGGRLIILDVILVVVVVVLGLAVHLWMRNSRNGLASLARSEDKDSAMLLGINVRTMSLIAFVAAGTIGGLAGPLVGAKTFASAFLPLLLVIKGFAALTLGGVGSQFGALIGGIFIGVLEALVQYKLGVNWGNPVIFAMFLALLLVRPQGLFGEREVRRV